MDQHKRIVNALLGEDSTKAHAYQTSATFRAAVDNLSVMLPAMVEGLLTASIREDQHRQNQIMAMALDRSRRVVMVDGEWVPASPFRAE